MLTAAAAAAVAVEAHDSFESLGTIISTFPTIRDGEEKVLGTHQKNSYHILRILLYPQDTDAGEATAGCLHWHHGTRSYFFFFREEYHAQNRSADRQHSRQQYSSICVYVSDRL